MPESRLFLVEREKESMKRKNIVSLLLLFAVLCLCACGQEVLQGWCYEPEAIPKVTENYYKLEEFTVESMEQPADICLFLDRIVISDKEKHCLFVLDIDGNVLGSVGTLGSGENEFMNPTGMTAYNDRLYVLDSGNDRIKVLDQNLTYVDSLKLDALRHKQGDHYYQDIAVDKDGVIYVSTDSVGKPDCCIYVIEDKKIRTMAEPFIGYLTEYDGEVYAVDTLEWYNEGGSEAAASGKNNLYKIEDDKIELVFQLPNKFTPVDFCFVEGDIFLLSALWGKFVRIEEGRQEMESLVQIENQHYRMYMEYIPAKEVFYISNLGDNKLYRISQ